jgi:hypothetical protein
MKIKFGIAALAVIAACGCSGDADISDNIIPPPPPTKNTVIGVWATTSSRVSDNNFTQMDRLARPVVNEVFATVANNRHEVNDEISPTQDPAELSGDIQKFMDEVFSFAPEGKRSQATVNVIKAVLVPDVMKADLGVSSSTAAYLGFETGGATGSKFGGRALTDDVVDISLGVVFGTTISALGLAPADGKDIPTLTSDHVGPEGKHFRDQFPYLGVAR